MNERLIRQSEVKKLEALRSLGRNKDYTVSEQPAAREMVIFINGVPLIPNHVKVKMLRG